MPRSDRREIGMCRKVTFSGTDQQIDARAEVGGELQVRKAREEAFGGSPRRAHNARFEGSTLARVGMAIEVRKLRSERPFPGLRVVELL